MTDLSAARPNWLKTYYTLRFVVSAAWVAAAFTLGRGNPEVAAPLLVAYPAWDAIANYLDARRSGGLGHNRSQMINFVVSVVTALAVAVALGRGMHAVLLVFGVWAGLSGLFQLITGARRWKTYGAQGAMILSGAQSMLAGVFMVHKASAVLAPSIADIAPYAGFGAFYFGVSALWLAVRKA